MPGMAKKDQGDPYGLQSDVSMVIGASLKPWRYSHKAVLALRRQGQRVIAIGLRDGYIDDVKVERELPADVDIDTVTFYLSAERQSAYYEYLMNSKPRRVIFNPGTENPCLANKLSAMGVETLEACTLVMLSAGQY